jgi:peptidoglycan/LPS O-acetylase OafA/YrhL
MVVVTHVSNFINERVHGRPGEYWQTGLSGVDIFFVISGFVMAFTYQSASNRGTADGYVFFARRIIRVVPLYWIATLTKVGLVAIFAHLANHSNNDPAHIIASLLFIPWKNADHVFLPVVPAGWTLNYEMFFYAIFAVSIWKSKRPIIFCSAILLSAAALYFLKAQNDYLRYYTNPIVLEFLFGMLIAQVAHRKPRAYDIHVGTFLLITGTLVIALTPVTNWVISNRWIVWGGSGAAIVMGLLLIERDQKSVV